MKDSVLNNGGFPPLIFKNINNKSKNNKERLIAPNIKNNINIRQILQINNTKNILEKNEKEEINIITSL